MQGEFYQDLCNPAAPRDERYERLLADSPLAPLVTRLWGDDEIWFMYEQVFLKEGGENRRTPWHQDAPYLSVEGEHLAVAWISLDPVAKEDSLEFVRGSHRATLYNTSAFDPDDETAPIYDGLPRLPDIERDRSQWDIVSWGTQPGDVLVFHPPRRPAPHPHVALLRPRRHLRRPARQRRGADGGRPARRAGAGRAVPPSCVPEVGSAPGAGLTNHPHDMRMTMSTTDDIVAIQQLLARYNTAADSGDGAGFAATFTEDGEAVNGARTAKGREALAAIGNSVATNVPGIRHWVNNHVIDVDGDHASATVYVTAIQVGADRKVLTTGRYADELQRTAEGWRFARRTFTAD
jgi:uncharacterized protein (TIGR02246 family)